MRAHRLQCGKESKKLLQFALSVTCHFIEDFSMSSCLLDCFEFSNRHTSENLAEELLRVVREWQVDYTKRFLRSVKAAVHMAEMVETSIMGNFLPLLLSVVSFVTTFSTTAMQLNSIVKAHF
jgi:hypothetical protein